MAFCDQYLGGEPWRVLSDFPGRDALRRRIADGVVRSVERVAGADVARKVADDGLDRIHLHLEPDLARPVAEGFVAEDRLWLLSRITEFARGTLGLADEFVLHSRPTMRIVFPFDQAKRAKTDLATFLVGVSGPIQNPDPTATAAYHGNLPLAAWTHGPHVDSWWGQPVEGISFWMSVCAGGADSGLLFYDGLGVATGLDHMDEPPYALPDQGLPLPSRPDPADGGVILFNPEILHATQVNTTERTRISLAIRINSRPLRFHPRAERRHEAWVGGGDPRFGPVDPAALFGPDIDPQAGQTENPTPIGGEELGEIDDVIPWARLPDVGVATGVWRGRPIVLRRDGSGCRAFVDQCPHLGGRLSVVPASSGRLTCNRHGMRFSAADGHAVCGDWRLESIVVEETADGVRLVG